MLLILSIVAVVFAIRYLPFWASLGIALLFLLNLRFLVRYLFTLPFKAKGAVLRGASVRVNDVTSSAAPAREESGAEPPETPERDFYLLDVTITPEPAKGQFRLWEPGDLALVKAGSKAGNDDAEPEGEIENIQVWKDGAFVSDEEYKYEGEQRLRLLAGVQRGVKELSFRYYFEIFGIIKLP
ncbi:MAG TPA: hypothetical protein VEK08_25990 [Planctomycetota bacterium]|nr:hypothetical protein [Planctomycetota bacterium]